MSGVVEVVVPVAVVVEAGEVAGVEEALGVVQVGLGEDERLAAELLGLAVGDLGDLGEDVGGGLVVDLVGRVEPEAVEPVVADPHADVVEDHRAGGVAVVAVVVDGRAPVGPVALVEVVAEGGEVVAVGAEVVVNHVEEDGHPLAVARLDESLEPLGTAVAVLRGERVDAVVSPASHAGKLADGHQLDGRDAQVEQARRSGE